MDYYKNPRISRSSICDLKISPYHYWCKNIGKTLQEDTECMKIGRAFHSYLLEEKDFDNQFIVEPSFDKRTVKGKEQYAQFTAKHSNKEVLTPKAYALIDQLKQAFKQHKPAVDMLKACTLKEHAYYFDYKGLEFKSKVDAISTNTHVIVDVKTIAYAMQEKQFIHHLMQYNYAEQVFLYSYAYEQEMGVRPTFLIISIAKKEPYEVTIYNASAFYDYGKMSIDQLIDIYVQCKDKWGISKNIPWIDDGITHLDLPAWAMHQVLESETSI